jgi:hypothetical protein
MYSQLSPAPLLVDIVELILKLWENTKDTERPLFWCFELCFQFTLSDFIILQSYSNQNCMVLACG